MRKHSHIRMSLVNQTLKKPIQRISEATDTKGRNGGVPHHWEQNWDASILKLLEAYETGPSQVAVTPVDMGNCNQGRKSLSRMDYEAIFWSLLTRIVMVTLHFTSKNLFKVCECLVKHILPSLHK